MTQVAAGRIKRKMLGIRMRSARMQVGLDIEQTAQHLGIAPALLNEYELGLREISLPELEAMAHLFGVSVNYFWSNGALREPRIDRKVVKAISIRHKIIGVLLQQMREAGGHSRTALAEALGCSADTVEAYERGEQPVPFNHLEALAGFFDTPLSRFMEETAPEAIQSEDAPVLETKELSPQSLASSQASVPAAPAEMPSELAWLAEMPDEVKEFLADPSSLLYLKLSMRLHGLSAETLRALAEGILDITY